MPGLSKIKEFDPIQVHMAPFELIFNQNGSYRVWETSVMPPGLSKTPSENPKIRCLNEIPRFFPYLPLRALGVGGMGEAAKCAAAA